MEMIISSLIRNVNRILWVVAFLDDKSPYKPHSVEEFRRVDTLCVMATENQVRKVARECSLIFNALGDPNRQDILIMLETEGPLNVLQITERLNLARPTISHHLKILSNAGLLRSTKKSREIYYESEWSDASKNLKKFMKLLWDC